MGNEPPSVAIIGAGIIGGCIAWRLAQAGVPVKLFDTGTLGGETSSAGAGMLSPGGEFEKPSPWFDLGVESMRMYSGFVEELRQETGVPIDFKVCGCRQFVEPEAARRRAEFQTQAGVLVELTPDGLFYPRDAFVDPTHIVSALRIACPKRGVGTIENHHIAEIESQRYRAVVIAAGAWSDQIRVLHRGKAVRLPPVRPIKGHLIGFQLPLGSLGAMLRRGHSYVLQRSNGFSVAGSNEEDIGFDREINPHVCEEIHHHAAELFAPLADAKPCARWIGLRPFSRTALTSLVSTARMCGSRMGISATGSCSLR